MRAHVSSHKRFGSVLVLAGLLVVLLGTACASSSKKVRKRNPLPPDLSMRVDDSVPPERDAHMGDVTAAAAAQLDCPVEETTIRCIGRDVQGDCVHVNARGCQREIEYKFGAEAL